MVTGGDFTNNGAINANRNNGPVFQADNGTISGLNSGPVNINSGNKAQVSSAGRFGSAVANAGAVRAGGAASGAGRAANIVIPQTRIPQIQLPQIQLPQVQLPQVQLPNFVIQDGSNSAGTNINSGADGTVEYYDDVGTGGAWGQQQGQWVQQGQQWVQQGQQWVPIVQQQQQWVVADPYYGAGGCTINCS